jgi:hypothetical protein
MFATTATVLFAFLFHQSVAHTPSFYAAQNLSQCLNDTGLGLLKSAVDNINASTAVKLYAAINKGQWTMLAPNNQASKLRQV